MDTYIIKEMKRYKIMKMIDNIHELMDYIDDGYYNNEIAHLIAISNQLYAEMEELK